MSSSRQDDLEAIAKAELDQMAAGNLLWRMRVLDSPSSSWVTVDGKVELMLCSNNYLGLANNPELKLEAIKATAEYGVGSGAVRVICGTMAFTCSWRRSWPSLRRPRPP